MGIQLDLGLTVIRSYKRLAYTPWHALAEFVDNSTQSYSNNREDLDKIFAAQGESLEVHISYERNDDVLRIGDNAMGMSMDELNHALHVGEPPQITTGRSEFGMGLKTAACWFGDYWTVKTKKLGESKEYVVEVDVEKVAAGDNDLPYTENARDPNDHYTIVQISRLHRKMKGPTTTKIQNFLASMYRYDIETGALRLFWQGVELPWEESDDRFLKDRDDKPYKKSFAFKVDDHPVTGWVGVLNRGSRAKAGFSILRRGRVIRGYPDSWRPQSLFGQLQGSNDLVNQRLTGEVHLDTFEVSHTKDNIDWFGDQEEKLEDQLKDECWNYREVAKNRRIDEEDERGPTDLEVQAAVEEFQSELGSPELEDIITLEEVPPPEVVQQGFAPVLDAIGHTQPNFMAEFRGVLVKGYLAHDLTTHAPYVVTETTSKERIIVVINMHHPHLEQIAGADGFLNYLRHCTYDAIAEWQAGQKTASIDPQTIKLIKDRLLRVPMEIEMHEPRQEAEPA